MRHEIVHLDGHYNIWLFSLRGAIQSKHQFLNRCNDLRLSQCLHLSPPYSRLQHEGEYFVYPPPLLIVREKHPCETRRADSHLTCPSSAPFQTGKTAPSQTGTLGGKSCLWLSWRNPRGPPWQTSAVNINSSRLVWLIQLFQALPVVWVLWVRCSALGSWAHSFHQGMSLKTRTWKGVGKMAGCEPPQESRQVVPPSTLLCLAWLSLGARCDVTQPQDLSKQF